MTALSKFFRPQTDEQLLRRVAMVLMAAIAIVFVMLLVDQLNKARDASYYRFGENVIKTTPFDNTIYKFPR